jgi:RNA polymerase sigma-70 factor (ECF subfamily)
MRDGSEKRLKPYYGRLFGYAISLSQNRDTAHDLFQECMVRALSARSVPEQESAFRAWLFVIMRNLWIDRARSRQRKSTKEDEVANDQAVNPEPLDIALVTGLSVRQAFGRLSVEHREILALVDISGFSYAEAASMLTVPRGTVMSRVSRARRALAALLVEGDVVVLNTSREGRR